MTFKSRIYYTGNCEPIFYSSTKVVSVDPIISIIDSINHFKDVELYLKFKIFFSVEPVESQVGQLLLQFPEGKSLLDVNWIGVLSRRKKVSQY